MQTLLSSAATEPNISSSQNLGVQYVQLEALEVCKQLRACRCMQHGEQLYFQGTAGRPDDLQHPEVLVCFHIFAAEYVVAMGCLMNT